MQNLDEISTLIAYIGSVDPRLRLDLDRDLTDTRRSAWFTLLDEVPLTFSMQFAHRYYANGERQHPLNQPGMIRDAWRREADRQTLTEPVLLAETFGDAAREMGAPTWFRAAADTDAARTVREDTSLKAGTAEYRKAMDTATLDAVERVRTSGDREAPDHLRDQWAKERRCKAWKDCHCTHTECRAGFLDIEAHRATRRGLETDVAIRCPHCMDAVAMTGTRR